MPCIRHQNYRTILTEIHRAGVEVDEVSPAVCGVQDEGCADASASRDNAPATWLRLLNIFIGGNAARMVFP